MMDALLRRYFDELGGHASAEARAVSIASLLPAEEEPADPDIVAAQNAVLKASERLRAEGALEASDRLIRENAALLQRPRSGRASDEVRAILAEGTRRSWELLVAIIDRAPEELLEHIADEPVEDFFAQPEALAFIDEVSEQVQKNARFRSVLEQASDLPAEIEDLLDDADSEPS